MRNERVMKKLIDYSAIKDEAPEIKEWITRAGNYVDDFGQGEKIELQIDDIIKKALGELSQMLEADNEPDDLQNAIYQIAKSNEIPPKDFFKTLYQIILGSNRGPKIGPFILDIGRKKVANTLSSYVN